MSYYLEKVSKVMGECCPNKGQLEHVIQTRYYINKHFDSELTLNFLADVRFISKFHLIRLFKKYYGQTPKQYIIDKRIAPLHFEPAKTYQKALFDAGIPYTQFSAENVQQEFERLTKLGVAFSVPPTEMGTIKIAVFNDTCGNHIQIVEML